MSDDLIKRLGKSVWTLDEAADRIEQLERDIDELSVLTGMVKDGLEAKLTKVVKAIEASHKLWEQAHYGDVETQLDNASDAFQLTRAVLAELE